MPENISRSTLLDRARVELAGQFDLSKRYLIHTAPGVLDVMGGVAADDTGAIACQMPVDRSAAVLLQTRADDRDLQVFSFNLLDEHRPFTFRISLDRLAVADMQQLAAEFAEPGRGWAAHIAGCLYILHRQKWIDLTASGSVGLSIATYSDIPHDARLGANAAMQAATMKCLIEHFAIADRIDSIAMAKMCQAVAHSIAKSAQGIRQPLTSLAGIAGQMLCVRCQPCELLPAVTLPEGFAITGIFCGHPIDVSARNLQTRTATAMGQAMILSQMREMGRAAKRELLADPIRGYLANLDPDDYKQFFRPSLPQNLKGSAFLQKFALPADTAMTINPDTEYHILGAIDHHILEARRVARFIEFIQQSRALPLNDTQRFILMDKAGHLMYASHQSYMNDAMLGDERCDPIVQAIRRQEKAGLYGARMTDRGCGGTVAALGEIRPGTSNALLNIVNNHEPPQSTSRLIFKTTE